MKEWKKPEFWELDIKSTECTTVKPSGETSTCPSYTPSWGRGWGFSIGWFSPWFSPRRRK